MGGIRLVVNADDFGLCAGVNEGIQRAHRDGIVTQASMMVPPPSFADAVEIARSKRIPCGVHLTLIREFSALHYGPLVPNSIWPEDSFPPSLDSLHGIRGMSREILLAEMRAQIERYRATGIPLEHLDCHGGVADPSILSRLCEETNTPTRDLFGFSHDRRDTVSFDSLLHLSPMNAEMKQAALFDYLSELSAGFHLIVCHPAVADTELERMAEEATSSEVRRWASEYRVSDLDLLIDPDVRSIIDERSIRLTTLGEIERMGRENEGKDA